MMNQGTSFNGLTVTLFSVSMAGAAPRRARAR